MVLHNGQDDNTLVPIFGKNRPINTKRVHNHLANSSQGSPYGVIIIHKGDAEIFHETVTLGEAVLCDVGELIRIKVR